MVDSMEDSGVSLADLSDLDVSEVQEIRFDTLPAGSYHLEVKKAELTEGTNRDDEKRFIAEFKFEVLECFAVIDKNVDKDSLVGRGHTEKLYIVPAKAEEGIGLIRAFVFDMGCDNDGKLGAIIENTVAHRFNTRITHRSDPNDKTIVYARIKLDPRKK
jgi:hypothetical protein